MEHRTTILLPRALHARLTRLARREGSSLGELVRRACERAYGFGPSEERIAAARALREMRLPVGSPRRMKRESVPRPDDLLP